MDNYTITCPNFDCIRIRDATPTCLIVKLPRHVREPATAAPAARLVASAGTWLARSSWQNRLVLGLHRSETAVAVADRLTSTCAIRHSTADVAIFLEAASAGAGASCATSSRRLSAGPRSQTPGSVKNAYVFKRPTVADVRRERQLMHDELRDWTGRLRRSRDDFDAIIEEIESRMQIVRAINKMQAPLKKAPSERGR